MSKTKVLRMVTWLIAAVPIVVYLWVYPKLPEQIPVHFSDGQPDRYASKSGIETWLFAGLGILGLILMELMTLITEYAARRREISGKQILPAASLLVVLLFSGISVYYFLVEL
ncbi:hypothetical protein DCC85_03370 [Paenibacillus sp. CAA11]|uniref:DUF1648 domain-containing protein n=1 Tax=Paenibacillus sp. CAA11 TaxID=1532905 RepID=UPI000D36E081|nr:DUF1648 domain-containing protein [Paenibacillus sp. CAA11]AWB43356.1 hypothetical protein DCC85_03370 [Paenibacillus sp. CAA11]